MDIEEIRMLIAVALSIVICVLMFKHRRRVRTKGTRIVEEARSAGRVVQGRLENSTYLPGYPEERTRRNRMDRWKVVYVYTVDGREYQYRGVVTSRPKPEILLYYPEGRPNDALTEGRAPTGRGAAFYLWALSPFYMWLLLYYLLGLIIR